MEEKVILVNSSDEAIGEMEKMEVHQKGILHRAFSIFILNSHGKVLLQKRALAKYHSGGLWTNTCCGHPRPGEEIVAAANRRLQEEMGLSCQLDKAYSFIYKAELKNGLIEHELDHVLIGTTDSIPILNREEAEDWRYMAVSDVIADVKQFPSQYTEWFKMTIGAFFTHLSNGKL